MKYKVGDKVKIREDLHEGYYKLFCSNDMVSYKGKIVTIEKVFDDYYYIKEDSMWCWTDGMFEGLVSKVENNKNTKDKTIKTMKDFKIKDYKVYEDTALIVEFEDGTTEKAVANEDDFFDLERGMEITVLKHILGADVYKTMRKIAMKQIKAIDKAKEDKKKEEELIARKKAKAARKKARRLERKRKERIAEMKEAYLSAMKEHDTEKIRKEFINMFDDFDDCK